MHKEILHLLRCPKCRVELKLTATQEEPTEIIEGNLVCENNHIWDISEGVVDFRVDEQKSNDGWAKRYEKMNFDEVDREVSSRIPNNMKNIYDKTISEMVKNIARSKPKVLIDIATGRGMLLKEIVQSINSNIQIIATDLSFMVLKYDRIKFKKLNENAKVSYIVCDASRVPLLDNCVDIVTSFDGFFNMLDKMPEGVQEAYRVLKEDKQMLSLDFVVEENSNGYRNIEKCFQQNGLMFIEKFATLEGLRLMYNSAEFSDVEIKIIDENIGTKHDIGIIPHENEWFAGVLTSCRK